MKRTRSGEGGDGENKESSKRARYEDGKDDRMEDDNRGKRTNSMSNSNGLTADHLSPDPSMMSMKSPKPPKMLTPGARAPPPGFTLSSLAPPMPNPEIKSPIQKDATTYHRVSIAMANLSSPMPFDAGASACPRWFRVAPVTESIVRNDEATKICERLRSALDARARFIWKPKRDTTHYDVMQGPEFHAPSTELPPECKTVYGWRMGDDGVAVAWEGKEEKDAKVLFTAPTRKEFATALKRLLDTVNDGPCKTFTHNRLHILEARFNLHELLNNDLEHKAQRVVSHRDFYNVRKIDNHVHHSACMNQKHLLRFIKFKMKQPTANTDVVIVRNEKRLTLTQVFDSLGLTPYDLSVDTLDMHADKTFHRFDKFNLKYNPIGESRLREIFLKYNNLIRGRYLAEITQEVFTDLASNKYQFAEYRVSIYGRDAKEWDQLAEWVVDNKLFHANVRWMIQIPRLFGEYHKQKTLKNFQEMLNNIFIPLFECTADPSSHPKLHCFLQQCVGFDCVDDESIREKRFHNSAPLPKDWNSSRNPTYAMFCYYLYANLLVLNKWREARQCSTFAFRPHSGEAGEPDHLATAFLLAKSINHGLMLQKSPTLQYLYYLAQVGISMSPLSNNLLFIEYDKNPFPRFFAKGLNVTLSTDDPLMIHVTKEPLMEEYSVAAQVWKLTPIDMCEIARNSVLQSGFEHRFKSHWLGNDYWVRGVQGNDIRQTNVPDIRVEFRWGLLCDEMAYISAHSGKTLDLALIDPL